jgi:CHAT domain-containing protein
VFGLTGQAFDVALFSKNLALQTHTSMREMIAGFNDRDTKSAYVEWTDLKRSLVDVLSKTTRGNTLDSLEQLVAQKERQLAGMLQPFRDKSRVIRYQDVLSALEPGACAIEFIEFKKPGLTYTDEVYYAALVLTPFDTTPHFLPLFEEKQLAALLDKTGNDARQASNLYAAARSGELLDAAPAYGTALYKLIWRPIDSLLNTPAVGGGRGEAIQTVYFSPSGLLHRVAFAALPAGGKKVLSDQYALRQLGSTRALVVKTPEPAAQNRAAAIFGGVEYDRNTASPAAGALADVPDNRLWELIDRPRSVTEEDFDYLPGTLQEARRLGQLLAHHSVRASTHTGAQASEEALKALGADTVKSPDILHIATHGFFFPDPEKSRGERFSEENAFRWNENPLLRSGLVMAGANAAWTGQTTPGRLEDGIATAYEISHLNLSNTKLAVLSACQTGLGDIKGSEGVYGLQRAFKMAGVDYLLVSLWQAPDQETAEFMEAPSH